MPVAFLWPVRPAEPSLNKDIPLAHLNQSSDSIPILLVTGFLGSGKTTVLNHLLRQPALVRTAVVVNEFGDVGLDHELVEAATENLILLQSGCLCCTIRGDLVETLNRLLEQRSRGKVHAFDRVVIETTGLADPAPILHTLITDGFLSEAFHLDGVIATVDAAAGSATLDIQGEAVKQAAMADRILLTKTDLVEPDTVRALEERLRAINPGAPIIRAHNGIVDASQLLDIGFYDPKTRSPDVQAWLNAEAYPAPGHRHEHGDGHEHRHDHHHDDAHHGHHHHHHDVNRHDDRISAVSYTVNEPIAPEVFDTWLETLMLLCGLNILRMKGIVNVEGTTKPFVIHGVQHIFHPPVSLHDWPSSDRRSRIVLIGRDLTDEFLTESFGFLGSTSRYAHGHGDHEHEHIHGEVHA